MTIDTYLRTATRQLEDAGIPTARLDCLVLLEDILHTDRTQLLAHEDQSLTDEQLAELNRAIERRCKHEPLAYIRGKSEFYGHVFKVTPDTLEPRPETETMVTMFLDWQKQHPKEELRVVDVGTGSGAIAISVALALPDLEVMTTELNPQTLEVARSNAKTLKTKVSFALGNLIEPISNSPKNSILLCNLPYVPKNHTINQAAMQEPAMALFGGPDGLDLYRELFMQIDPLETKPVAIFTESLPFQHHGLAAIARQHGYVQEQRDDFIQLFELQ